MLLREIISQSCRDAAMTVGKSEDDYGGADDCFDVNESGGRDSDRCTTRYFHPKVSGDLPKALYVHSDQVGGDMPGCHIKGERKEGIWPRILSLPGSQASQPARPPAALACPAERWGRI